MVLKTKGHPLITQQMRDMLKADAPDDDTLVVTFAAKRGRDVPLFVAALPIFSQAYYTAHPFEESTLETPLGSGPYKVGKFEVGRYIEFTRVDRLVGSRLAGQSRQLQFRRHQVRFLPRSRCCFRRFHRPQLSLP